jgi:dTDP-4-dehydrorhamnose reductase
LIIATPFIPLVRGTGKEDFSKMPTALVTGANGFIGSRLCSTLLEKGYKVWGLVRKTSDLSYLKGLDVSLIFDDVTDPVNLPDRLKKVDFIFHIAGLIKDWGPYEIFHRANVTGTLNILKYARLSHAKKTVILSSTSVMGFGRTNMTEDHPKRPPKVNYIASKLQMEEEALAYACEHRMRITILRPGDVYGEYDRTVTLLMFEALEKGTMGFINSGKACLAPLYVHNLIDAMIKAVQTRNTDGKIYNITDGVKINWNDYVAQSCEFLGRPKPKLNVPYFLGYSVASVLEGLYGLFKSKEPPMLTRYRIMHGGLDYHFDISRARKELKYDPCMDIRKNLKTTADWYMAHKQKKVQILITGVSGFWGYNIAKHLLSRKRKDWDIIGTYQTSDPGLKGVKAEKLDLSDLKKVRIFMNRVQPDVVIHTAAMSKIADCEKHPKQAMVVNFKAVQEIVRWTNLYKSRFIFFSTDLVYAGDKKIWRENDPVKGLHVYEKSKILAEEYIRKNSYDHIILRTGLSYGPPSPRHSSFLGWMIAALDKKEPMKLFTDQFRTPISTFDGVRFIERLMNTRVRNRTMNFGGQERIDRYSFGLKFARIFGYDIHLIIPVKYKDVKDPYKPSADSSMDNSEITKWAGKSHNISQNLVQLKRFRRSGLLSVR